MSNCLRRMNNIIIRESKGFLRMGNKEELSLRKGESVFSKRKNLPYQRVERIYNSKGELIAIDVIEEKGEEMDIIQNIVTGLTIVIIHSRNGDKFKGVAKCCKEDDYLPEVGYRLAYNRALKKKCEFNIKKMEG